MPAPKGLMIHAAFQAAAFDALGISTQAPDICDIITIHCVARLIIYNNI
jgi:hypothetical protein